MKPVIFLFIIVLWLVQFCGSPLAYSQAERSIEPTESERRVAESAKTGNEIDLRYATVRAEFISKLLTEQSAPGVDVVGVKITWADSA